MLDGNRNQATMAVQDFIATIVVLKNMIDANLIVDAEP